jgi:hypothetical protein
MAAVACAVAAAGCGSGERPPERAARGLAATLAHSVPRVLAELHPFGRLTARCGSGGRVQTTYRPFAPLVVAHTVWVRRPGGRTRRVEIGAAPRGVRTPLARAAGERWSFRYRTEPVTVVWKVRVSFRRSRRGAFCHVPVVRTLQHAYLHGG